MESTINIRNISVKCGNCNTYQTLATFSMAAEFAFTWFRMALICRLKRTQPAVCR